MKIKEIPVKLKATIKGLSRRKSGCSTSFYKVGVKLFTSEEDRDYAYAYQKYACSKGFGPKIGEKIQVGSKPGYLTELANMKRTSTEDLEKLKKKMKKIHLDFMDNHWGNVGYVRGKLVCIDFDKYSVACTNLRKTKLPEEPWTDDEWN